MSTRPLVSVVTGTWQRHDLLMEAIANVRSQTYPNIEHVIVSDGPDQALVWELAQRGIMPYLPMDGMRVPIRFVLSQGGLDLYWPAAATGLRLQRTPALDPEAHWVNIEAPVAVAGEEFRVHLSPQSTSELFRLSR